MSNEQLVVKNLRWVGFALLLISLLGYNNTSHSYDGSDTKWKIFIVLSLILMIAGHKYWQHLRSLMDED